MTEDQEIRAKALELYISTLALLPKEECDAMLKRAVSTGFAPTDTQYSKAIRGFYSQRLTVAYIEQLCAEAFGYLLDAKRRKKD